MEGYYKSVYLRFQMGIRSGLIRFWKGTGSLLLWTRWWGKFIDELTND